MTLRTSAGLRDAMLNRIDTDFPAGSIAEVRSGAQPAAVTDPATGTLLASIALPASPWAPAANGVKAKSGTWQDAAADATGTAGWFRLKNAADTLRMDGAATAIGGGGEMEIDNPALVAGQQFTITSFTVTL